MSLLASERRVCCANIESVCHVVSNSEAYCEPWLREWQVRSGKQDLVERQNATPNAKFCLYPLRPLSEEGANNPLSI